MAGDRDSEDKVRRTGDETEYTFHRLLQKTVGLTVNDVPGYSVLFQSMKR